MAAYDRSSHHRHRSRSTPVSISAGGSAAPLERISLDKGEYNEAWLQALIHHHPLLLPVSDIEPGFGELIAVAREILCNHGVIDNLYVTPSGEIVLVETKLWRNVQARREVVAQALDYVSALMRMPYETFEAAILKARGDKAGSLYDLVAEHPDALDEAGFIDAVARNLSRGRLLVIALGDGIRQEAHALAELLQSHAGAHFTFALVEIGTFRNTATGEITAIADTLAQTVMIERGIVRVENGVPIVTAVPASHATAAQTISEGMFFDGLAKRGPGVAGQLRHFITSLEDSGIYTEPGRSLQLRADLPGTPRPLSLGYIAKNGQLWTDNVVATAPAGAGMAYLEALATIVGGAVKLGAYPSATTNGSSAPYVDQLLANAPAWHAAIETLVTAARQGSGDRG
jgi:hypothetical protein